MDHISVATITRLDELSNLRDEVSRLEAKRKEVLDEIVIDLAPQIKAVNEVYDEEREALQSEIHELDNLIKDSVGNLIKGTVKGEFLMAVYSKPRVTWDGSGLLGYMVAHPEIKAFKRVGKPSVSIRRV